MSENTDSDPPAFRRHTANLPKRRLPVWFGCLVASNPLKAGKELWAKNRRRILIIGAVIVVAWIYLSGSGRPDTKRAEIPEGYASAGRELAVHAEAKPDKPVPLVLVLHDNHSDAATIEKASKVSTIADRRGFAVAYPQAVASTWRLDDPNGVDIQYLRDVVDYVARERSDVDRSRVYIWGIGEGGRAALAAACGSPGPGGKPLFATVGVVGQVGQAPSCPPQIRVVAVDDENWSEGTTRDLWNSSREVALPV